MPHLRSTLFIFTLAVALMLGACRGGSAPAMALSIDNLTPSGLVGTPGQEVQFVAMVDDATITTAYAWSVTSGGGTWDNSSAEQPTLTLGSAATYTVTLTVTEGMDTDTATVSITVSATPVVTGVVLDPASGLPLGIGTATATVVGEYDDVEWDMGGGGEIGDSGSLEPGEAITDFTFQDAGTFEGQVRVHGSGGWGDWEPFEVEVEVPVAPEWTTLTLGAAAPHYWTRSGVSLTIHDGKLALVNTTPDGIALTLATVENPTSASDFTTHIVDPDSGASTTGYNAIVSSEGRLLIAYVSPDSFPAQMRVATATVATPTSAGDWAIQVLDSLAGSSGFGSSLITLDGSVMVMWAGGSSGVLVGVSDDAHPTVPEDWTVHEMGEDFGAAANVPQPDIQLFEGKVHASLTVFNITGGVRLASALVEEPVAHADWSVVDVWFQGENEMYPTSLEFLGDRPVISYSGPRFDGSPLLLVVPDSAIPETWSDFSPLTLSEPLTESGGGAMISSANRLAIVYRDLTNKNLMVARAVGSDATDPAAWTRQIIAPMTNPSAWASVIEFEGRMVVAWVDKDAGVLKLSLADGPF